MVVTDSDFAVPSELDMIVFDVVGPAGQMESREVDPREGLPASLGLVHTGGPLGPVDVRVVGRVGAAFVERAARLDFAPGRTVLLQMDLLRACETVVCVAGMSCGGSGCAPIDVDVATLPDWEPTPVDAGMDGMDTGPVDTGADSRDTGPGDTNPPDTRPMDTGPMDTGPMDTGPTDTSPPDTSPPDTGPMDTCLPTETCNMLDDDCDMMVDEGFILSSDPLNCGMCGNVCSYPNGTPLCVFGFCGGGTCNAGFGNCDADTTNGCETDVNTDMMNCGRCGMRCSGMRTCVMGTCT